MTSSPLTNRLPPRSAPHIPEYYTITTRPVTPTTLSYFTAIVHSIPYKNMNPGRSCSVSCLCLDQNVYAYMRCLSKSQVGMIRSFKCVETVTFSGYIPETTHPETKEDWEEVIAREGGLSPEQEIRWRVWVVEEEVREWGRWEAERERIRREEGRMLEREGCEEETVVGRAKEFGFVKRLCACVLACKETLKRIFMPSRHSTERRNGNPAAETNTNPATT